MSINDLKEFIAPTEKVNIFVGNGRVMGCRVYDKNRFHCISGETGKGYLVDDKEDVRRILKKESGKDKPPRHDTF